VIERHIEKIILAVFVLLLAFTVIRWGVASPLKVEVVTNGQGSTASLPPRQADRNLLRAAQDISQYVDSRKPQPYEVADYRLRIERLNRFPFRPVPLASLAVADRPLTAYDIPVEDRPSLKEIVKVMPAPTKPRARVERELPKREGVAPADVVAAHVAATYPWQELRKQWLVKIPASLPADLIVASVDAEIRERRFDGSWGDPIHIKTIRSPIASGRPGYGQTIPVLPDFNGKNAEVVRNTIDELVQWQQEILEPSYWDILWFDSQYGSWKKHLPDNPVSDKASALEASASTTAGAGLKAGPITGLRRERTGGGRGVAPAMSAKEAFMKRGAMGGPMGPMGPRGPRGARPRRSRRSYQPRRPAVPSRRTAPVAVNKEVEMPKVTPVPPLAEQVAQGQVLFWLHDISLEPARVYQFRVRLAFVNPLVTYVDDVDKPADATPAVVRTPFSEWSNPVSVPQETEFFVISQNSSQGYASVVVFARKWGQWVSKRFRVSEGQMIGGPGRVSLINPENDSLVTEEVDFSTGTVAVRLDFNKTVLDKGNNTRTTVEMFCLDQKGQFSTRIEALDKKSSRYEWLRAEVKLAKAAGQR